MWSECGLYIKDMRHCIRVQWSASCTLRMNIQARIKISTQTKNKCTHTHIHTRMHIYTHMHIHRHIYTHMHVLTHMPMRTQAHIYRVGQNFYIHHIWPYIWWFPCQKYRIHTVYIWFGPTLHIYTLITACPAGLAPWSGLRPLICPPLLVPPPKPKPTTTDKGAHFFHSPQQRTPASWSLSSSQRCVSVPNATSE